MSDHAVQDADHPGATTLRDAVRQAITAGNLTAGDGAAVALVVAYARAIDQAGDAETFDPEALAELGPKLLAGLTALGLTPAGRGKVPQNPPKPDQGSVLDGLMERAQARRARASNAVDTADGGPDAADQHGV